jgi:hypothetical protein
MPQIGKNGPRITYFEHCANLLFSPHFGGFFWLNNLSSVGRFEQLKSPLLNLSIDLDKEPDAVEKIARLTLKKALSPHTATSLDAGLA